MGDRKLFEEWIYIVGMELEKDHVKIILDEKLGGFLFHRHKLAHLEVPLDTMNEVVIEVLRRNNNRITFKSPIRHELVCLGSGNILELIRRYSDAKGLHPKGWRELPR